MHSPSFAAFRLIALFVFATLSAAAAAETLVKDQQEYFAAAKNAKPGDTIVLANGVWKNFEIVLDAEGTSAKPITLRAEDKGKVVISGLSNLRIAGKHLIISGLVFKAGHTPTNEVIAFRRSEDRLAHHSRVTEVVIDHFNNPERFENDSWVMMYGQNNRFDHNHLEGKSNAGVTMAVRLDSESSQNNHHRIDHNYFGPRPVLGSNGGETLRLGTSKYSLTDSYTVVENNYFDRCNGEVEIVSNKSGHNTFRGNVFFESRGTLTLRHGNDNLIENNVFFGNNVDHTGGIRLINKRQTIRNNYLSGLNGHRFGGALVVMNGVPNSSINRYHQVEDSLIENNTIIDSDHIELAAGSDDERSAVPLSTRVRRNLIVNSDVTDSIAVHDDISGIDFADNVAAGVAALPDAKGFREATVQLRKASNGLLYPADKKLAGAGVSADLRVLPRDHTGVSWYPKPGYADGFDSGATLQIKPGQDSLHKAMLAAGAGDIIELQSGIYRETRINTLDKPLTIRAVSNAATRPVIQFERSALFQIDDGGSLRLAGIKIDGSIAPDAYGNSAIRTSRYSMLGNYRLLVDDIQVANLNTNHSFNFFTVEKHTFADRIEIHNSRFADITGHVLQLDREIDDLGIYNAEYVTIADSAFHNVDKSLVSLYRGGTDESTFGPHFLMQRSELENIGRGKRNKTRASVFLLGVQRADIDDNTLADSQPIRVIETVGEPVTRLANNKYSNTPAAQVAAISEIAP